MSWADSFTLPMNIPDIQRCIPHRSPFLFIDKIVDYEVGKYIKAIKMVEAAEPILAGHFPGNPILPGVIMIEAMAQASAVLGKLTLGKDCETCLLMEVSSARFRRIVTPGDLYEMNIQVTKQRGGFFWFTGEGSVAGETAATVQFSAKLA